MVILLYIAVILNCFVNLSSQSNGTPGIHPASIEVKDEKSYWQLYSIVHQAGNLPILNMKDIVESLKKLHEFTNRLSIDKTRKSYINQRIDGLINMRDSKDCSMNLVHQISRAVEENQDYTMHLVPYIHLMADGLLVGCQEKVSDEVEKMQSANIDAMNVFNKLLDNVLRAQITEGEDPIPGFNYDLPVELERPYDYIPHQQIVNGLIDYLDENYSSRHFETNQKIYEMFDNIVMRQVTNACKEVMATGESTLDKFDAIYEADNTKVNSFDDKTLKFLTGLRVCEHLKYINNKNVIEYYQLYKNRATFNLKTRNHQLSVRQRSNNRRSKLI